MRDCRSVLARLAAGSLLASGLALAAPAHAGSWSWSLGSGERVQGSGQIATEARNLGAFDAISVAGHFDVRVRQGAAESVEVRVDHNLLPLIETRIVDDGKGRVLEVGVKRGYSLQSRTPVLTIDVKALRSLALSGSGDVKVDSLKSERLDASVAGSGDLLLSDLQVPRLAISVSGSGDVIASGRADSLTVSIAGSGDVNVAQLEAGEVKVSVAGSGDAQVHALRDLKVSIAGSGDVRYRGSPRVESSIAGSGTVRRLATP